MRLCFLAGANSIHSQKWIKYFADKGHEIHWISLTPNCFDRISNVKYYFLKEFSVKPLDILFNAIPIRKLIRKISPDILHAHYAGVNGALAALSGFHPFVLTVWGSDILVTGKSKIKRPLVKFGLERADLITCNSELLKQEIVKLNNNVQKIKFIYWGTDIQKFKPGSAKEEIRERLEIVNSFAIISLRNLEPIYNVETLIKCIPFVLKKDPRAKFIIAGKGSEEKKLKKIATDLNVFDSVKFVGWIPSEEMPHYLRTVDLLVSTSLSDGDLSQGTQQAMACGLPIITTDLTVNRHRIKNGENGIIFPTKDPEALAEKIITLLKDKEFRTRLGEKGRKTIKNNLDHYKEMQRASSLYEKLISSFNLIGKYES